MGWIETKIEHIAETVVVESEKTRTELATMFASSLRGRRLDGLLPRAIRANASNYGSSGRLMGWSLRATGGNVVITFRDGQSTDGEPIGTVCLADGESQTVAAPGTGVSFVSSLWTEVTGSGTVVGAVWLGAVD